MQYAIKNISPLEHYHASLKICNNSQNSINSSLFNNENKIIKKNG